MTGDKSPADKPRVLLVDPAVFTGPYDAALTGGLQESGISAAWATRSNKAELLNEIPTDVVYPIYYPGIEQSAKQAGFPVKIRKGLSHVASTQRLIRLCRREMFNVLHFQWLVLSVVDLLAIKKIRSRMPIVLTVHDSTPFNGNPTSRAQRYGYKTALNAVDHLIVHTRRAKDALVADGVPSKDITVIPHGPLPLPAQTNVRSFPHKSSRWTYVLFGRLQDYKGLDTLVDALATMDPIQRARFRVIVAGEPFMDTDALRARAEHLGVADTLEWRTKRLSHQEMAELFEEADSFIFPYKKIDASGVYYTVKGYKKWIIASDLGAFSDEISDDVGALFPAGDQAALAKQLADGVGRKPAGDAGVGSSWSEIGKMHANLYRDLLQRRAAEGQSA
ncbi:glycosyltransferase [Paracoccus tibetensis]|uniref:Glycosyltransferase involved in cell wall bisynthesis n=1 Tax=Paracoccus tibetensis TaxID=336292 RepID=A0A1G5C1E0_9RHOB|nr:glycosyltransferase [Paracoccus tibetensis]SCX96191.1 Glycosyltransferase involved in cell wall bisynthesis [Paracoccus tibetensis]